MAYTEAAYEGLAWLATQQGGRLLSVAGNAGLAEFTSSASETIDALYAYLQQVIGGSDLSLEVYESADLPHSESTETYRPNSDSSHTSPSAAEWVNENGTSFGSANFHESIDESSLDQSDYLDHTGGGTEATAYFGFGSGSFPSDRVVLAVRIKAVVENDADSGFGGSGFWVVWEESSAGQGTEDGYDPLEDETEIGGGEIGTLTFERAANPATGQPWTPSDIQGMVFGVRGSDGPRVYQLWVEVDWRPAPLTSGSLSGLSGDGWAKFVLSPSWGKGSGADYALVLRKTNRDGQAVMPLLDSDAACPHVGWSSRLAVVDSRHGDDAFVVELDSDQTAVHPLVLETSGGSASADSQPYAALVRESVHSGRTVEQEITPGSSLTAGWVRVVAACHPDTADDLTVEVRKRSDDSVVGTLAVSPGDLPDPDSPRKLQQVDGPLDSTGSVGTSQHYVHLSSTEPESTAWEVAVLDADSPPVSAESAGFGGTTDQATVDGTEDDDLDLPVILAERPSAPSGFTATAGTAEVSLSWDATSLGGSFDRYLVWRNGYVIAEVTDESITALTDTGALMGVEETWAIQVQDTDGVVSTKATDTATAEVLTAGKGSHRVTSLHDPTVDVGLRASADQMTWRFPNRVSQQRQMGRDGHRVLRAKRGKAEVLEITANLGVGQPEQDRALFDGLLALRDADVPHLTLTTIWGHRMLCAVRVDEGSERQIVDWGQATVRLVSVGDRPTPATVSTT